MTDLQFYEPEATDDPLRYRFQVTPPATVGPPDRKFLMGGVALGAAVSALERATGRSLLWATAQYLSFATTDDVLDLELDLPAQGRNVTQGGVVCRKEGQPIVRVLAALGARPDQPPQQYAHMPEVPPPTECELIPHPFADQQDLSAQIEKRRALADEAGGSGAIWFLMTQDLPPSAALTAIVADHLAGALRRTAGAASLDNTIRLHAVHETSAYLCVSAASGIASGVFHGHQLIYADDGTLLATASQSGVAPKAEGEWAQSHVKSRVDR